MIQAKLYQIDHFTQQFRVQPVAMSFLRIVFDSKSYDDYGTFRRVRFPPQIICFLKVVGKGSLLLRSTATFAVKCLATIAMFFFGLFDQISK